MAEIPNTYDTALTMCVGLVSQLVEEDQREMASLAIDEFIAQSPSFTKRVVAVLANMVAVMCASVAAAEEVDFLEVLVGLAASMADGIEMTDSLEALIADVEND